MALGHRGPEAERLPQDGKPHRRGRHRQPHFITWIFQGENIAYNVSVEMHGSGDMYYYIARGIELLAEGERRNSHTVRDPPAANESSAPRHSLPDRLLLPEQVRRLRSGGGSPLPLPAVLYPEAERNPDDLIDPDGGRRPQGIPAASARSIRTSSAVLRGEDRKAEGSTIGRGRRSARRSCPRRSRLCSFCARTGKSPRFKNARELDDPDKQFPGAPPQFADGQNEANPGSPSDDDFSAYKAARAGFTYARVPLPPNPRDWEGKPMPWRTPYPDEYNQLLYRVPAPAPHDYLPPGAPRVQSFQAEMEQKEGWFDAEGWRIDDPSDQQTQTWWFPDPDTRPANNRGPLDIVVAASAPGRSMNGAGPATCGSTTATNTGWNSPRIALSRYRARVAATGLADVPPRRSPPSREKYAASLQYLEQNRRVTNFAFFLASATGEAKRETVQRKTSGRPSRPELGNKQLATRLYLDGLNQWKAVLAGDRNSTAPRGRSASRSRRTSTRSSIYACWSRTISRIRERANALVSPMRSVVPF